MIDAGAWQGSGDHLSSYVRDLKNYVDNEVDVLVVTHEHRDHVLAFERCKNEFQKNAESNNNFKAKKIWLGWPEDDKNAKVKKWKKKYGQKKFALALATEALKKQNSLRNLKTQYKGLKFEKQMIKLRKNQIDVIDHFRELNIGSSPVNNVKKYIGSMEGMRIVKEEIENDGIKYYKSGTIIKDQPNAPGLRFYVLGPPNYHSQVKKENSKKEGESYDHSHNNDTHQAFADILSFGGDALSDAILPFDQQFLLKRKNSKQPEKIEKIYKKEAWRKVDDEWLYNSGSLALRMNSLTNNLSLALAIEIEQTGEVLLFPGDAEYGSWESWHKIDWGEAQDPNKKHLTEDLLNRTILYKVAHHMSHNGTAKAKGLEMMTNEKLSAMVTVDYEVISKGWKNTMPNKYILDELLEKTKGRIIFNNEKNIQYDETKTLTKKLKETRDTMDKEEKEAWKENFKTDRKNKLFHQLTIKFDHRIE